MINELDYHKNSIFLTLTYAPEHIPAGATLEKEELQKFFKRFRRLIEPRKIKYYACGEYGTAGNRPHYHAIMFGVGKKDKPKILQAWPKGFIHIGTVTYDSARYVADYIQKKYSGQMAKDLYTAQGKNPPFQLQSLGLGKQFALDNAEWIKNDLNITIYGRDCGIPKYYKKILDVDQDKLIELAKKEIALAYEFWEKRDDALAVGLNIQKSRKQRAKDLDAKFDQNTTRKI